MTWQQYPPQQQPQYPSQQPQQAPQQHWGPPPGPPPPAPASWGPPPGQPQQQPQYPSQQGYGPPGGSPQGYMPGPAPAAQPQMPPPPATLPQTYLPDEARVAEAFRQAREEQERQAARRAGGGGDPTRKYFDLKVNGEKKFSKLPVGSEARYVIWICSSPPPKPGEQPQFPFAAEETHFWKSHRAPQGSSLPCLGEECPICVARTSLFRTQDEEAIKHAKANGRVGKKALYQVLLLEHPQEHVHEDGVVRPLIFRAPQTVHDEIVAKFNSKGIAKCIDPMMGRPFLLQKRKTGPQDLDVEWRIDDLDPTPLPQQFWGALQNLHDLSTLTRSASVEDYAQALQEMRLPMTHEVQALLARLATQQPQAQQQQPQQSWSPNPNPPGQSPYAQPPQAPPQQPPQQQWGPPQAPPQQQPPQPQWGPPQQPPQPQQWGPPQAPPQAPSYSGQAPWGPPPPGYSHG